MKFFDCGAAQCRVFLAVAVTARFYRFEEKRVPSAQPLKKPASKIYQGKIFSRRRVPTIAFLRLHVSGLMAGQPSVRDRCNGEHRPLLCAVLVARTSLSLSVYKEWF